AAPGIDVATLIGLRSGAQDVLRDISADPLSYGFLEFGTLRNPAESTTRILTLRAAGPLPVSLPGGYPTLNLLVERTEQWNDNSRLYQSTAESSIVLFTPERWQDTNSAYAEFWAPVIGPDNNIPFVHEFGVGASVRYDEIEGRGSLVGINCLSVPRPLT